MLRLLYLRSKYILFLPLDTKGGLSFIFPY